MISIRIIYNLFLSISISLPDPIVTLSEICRLSRLWASACLTFGQIHILIDATPVFCSFLLIIYSCLWYRIYFLPYIQRMPRVNKCFIHRFYYSCNKFHKADRVCRLDFNSVPLFSWCTERDLWLCTGNFKFWKSW